MKITATPIVLGLFVLGACSDGGGSTPPAPPVNQAPVLSAIADKSTPANQPSAPINFTVTDEMTGALTFTFQSDTPSVIPEGSLSVAGSGASRTLMATPVDDTLGNSLITVIATDGGGLSASASFLLSVFAEPKTLRQFTRETFAQSATGEPELINAIEFSDDAENDDFADLLEQ